LDAIRELPPDSDALVGESEPLPYQQPQTSRFRKGQAREFWVGKGPMVAVAATRYRRIMNLLLLVIVLLLLFGGGGFYFGGPVIGGGGLGLVLVICLIIYFMGGFRSKA
jgi:hypothetical protein